MDNQLTHERILSESYADILAARELPRQDIQQEYASFGAQEHSFSVCHVPRSFVEPARRSAVRPWLLQHSKAVHHLGYHQPGTLRHHPGAFLSSLDIQREQVLIGFLDTGIAWQAPAFRNPDGTTRIAGI